MKKVNLILVTLLVFNSACRELKKESVATAETDDSAQESYLFIDVHNLEPGKVDFAAAADAHAKDLATQEKYDVNFLKFWVDEELGKVYCMAQAKDSASVSQAHKEAHGLIPDHVYRVTGGLEAAMNKNSNLYLDFHQMGPGNVTAAAVADVHVKDLAVQEKHGTNLLNYWVDVKTGTVMCLAEANHPDSLINTHKEAHGLLPNEIHEVRQGQ